MKNTIESLKIQPHEFSKLFDPEIRKFVSEGVMLSFFIKKNIVRISLLCLSILLISSLTLNAQNRSTVTRARRVWPL